MADAPSAAAVPLVTTEDTSSDIFYFDQPGNVSPSAQTDLVHEYTPQLADSKNAIIIDNGSCWCRVGWSCEDEPRLVFRNILAKPKAGKDQPNVVSVGNAIQNFDSMRSYLKTPFERNVIVNFDWEEHIFDYIFNRLGINTVGQVNHPIVITECVWNPLFSRKCMSEMLFEAYKVPGVCYTVDALAALHHFINTKKGTGNETAAVSAEIGRLSKTCLIVSIGSSNTHIVPVIDDTVQWDDVRRITLGGSNFVYYMQRLLQLKYPHHWAAISLIRAEKLVHKFAYFADDYHDELTRWREDAAYTERQTIVAQLPFSAVKQQDLAAARKDAEERRRRNAERLREMARQNRMQRLVENEARLRDLRYAARLFIECRAAETDENIAVAAGITEDGENVDAVISSGGGAKRPLTDDEREEKLQQAKQILYNYDVTEQDLDAQTKRLETSLKRSRDKLEHEQSAAGSNNSTNNKKSKADPAPADEAERARWLADMRRHRAELLEKREKRRERREQMSKRGTYAAQQRMRILTQLACNKKAKLSAAPVSINAANAAEAADDFGRNDSDWHIYREINIEAGDSESEEEREQLSRIEDSLYEHDDDFRRQQKDGFVDENSAEFYQLRVGVERCRCTEILFQPALVGIDQRGLCEAIQFVIGRYDAATQVALASNVLVTGSATAVPGLCARLQRELVSWRPFRSVVHVSVMATCSNDSMSDSALDAWKGLAEWVRDGSLSNNNNISGPAKTTTPLITKQTYDEMGHEYLSEHALSNKWLRRRKEAANSTTEV